MFYQRGKFAGRSELLVGPCEKVLKQISRHLKSNKERESK